MRYIFELNHPKHYYQFKYIMSILQNRGHSVLVLARNKDVLLRVLQEENIPYTIFGTHKDTLLGKVFSSISIFHNYKRIATDFAPDIIISKASIYGTLTAKVLNCKSYIFPDSEVVALTNKFVVPLATCVITPEPFSLDYGAKHKKIRGLFEDCYLSPLVLSIDENYAEKNGLKKPYAILRFVGWSANHDVNNKGFSLPEKTLLADMISKYMTVYVSSEKDLPPTLAKYKLFTPAAQIHNVLANADLYIGDSQTMATEAALLGTPAIRSNSFVGPNDMSNFKMLEKKYGLLFNIRDFDAVMSKTLALLKESPKEDWTKKRAIYYEHVGDVNAQIVDMIENNY